MVYIVKAPKLCDDYLGFTIERMRVGLAMPVINGCLQTAAVHRHGNGLPKQRCVPDLSGNSAPLMSL